MAPRVSQVTPSAVRKAVLWLEGSGKKPTVVAVRKWLEGGSTKLIAEILKNQKDLEASAVRLAEQITVDDIFNVICRELPVAMSNSLKEITEASLACCFISHNDASEMSVREYVESGFNDLSIIEDNVEIKINDLYMDMYDYEEDKNELQKELWLRAYSHAARHVDKKDLTLLFVESWLELNENLDY